MSPTGDEPPAINLRAPLDPALVGFWRSRFRGTKLEELGPVKPHFVQEITLRPDGTADWRWPEAESQSYAPETEPPFPTTWETLPEGRLTIYLPIAPMPEYELRADGLFRRQVMSDDLEEFLRHPGAGQGGRLLYAR
jgi:hypothetical protein